MAAELNTDPFVSTEPEVELDEETLQLLDARVAKPGGSIPADEARKQISEWLSSFSTAHPR
jgi:hypothetical protein